MQIIVVIMRSSMAHGCLQETAMTTRRRISLALGAAFVTATFALNFFTTGCAATSHPTTPATLGLASAPSSLEAVVDEPGPITVETVVGADWAVPLSGLLNLDHPLAKGIKDRDEPIQVAFHAIHHPTRGTYLVDTGVERALWDAPDEAAIQGLARKLADFDKMKRRTDTHAWIARQQEPIRGVFLTHLHADHVSGMRDVPSGTPVFVGPGEATSRSLENLVVAPIVNRALEGKPALSVWRFQSDRDGLLDGVVDVFGDGSFWALHVPGHTPGSTAYLARTRHGAVLMTGDACHTRWGWDHGVEPGSFSSDKRRSAESLAHLRGLVARHPNIEVRVGHQLTSTEADPRALGVAASADPE